MIHPCYSLLSGYRYFLFFLLRELEGGFSVCHAHWQSSALAPKWRLSKAQIIVLHISPNTGIGDNLAHSHVSWDCDWWIRVEGSVLFQVPWTLLIMQRRVCDSLWSGFSHGALYQTQREDCELQIVPFPTAMLACSLWCILILALCVNISDLEKWEEEDRLMSTGNSPISCSYFAQLLVKFYSSINRWETGTPNDT